MSSLSTSCECASHWIIPVRVIRSFEYRTMRTVVLKNVCPYWTTDHFVTELLTNMADSSAIPKVFLKHTFDCVKILHKPHAFKTNNPVINLDHDEWILVDGVTLQDSGIVDQTEMTFFNRADYEQYKLNPEHKLS